MSDDRPPCAMCPDGFESPASETVEMFGETIPVCTAHYDRIGKHGFGQQR